MSRSMHSIIYALIFFGGCLPLMAVAQDATSEEKSTETKPTTTIDPQIPIEQLKVLVKPLTKSELQVEADAWMELLRQKAGQIAAARLGVQKTNEAISADDQKAAEAAVKAAKDAERQAQEEVSKTGKELTEKAENKPGLDESQTASTENENDSAEREANGNVERGSDDVETVATAKKEKLLDTINELQEERTAIVDRLEVVLASLEAKGGDVKKYRDYATAVSGIEIDTTDASAAWTAITGWLTSKEGGQRWAWNFAKFSLILLISYMVSKIVAGVVNWLLERKIKLTQLAKKLISRSIKNLIMFIGFAIALTALEIDITPILAAIGAAGLVIGLALQGTLSNFASGLLILINRPFDEGDVVSAGGVTGVVNKMNLVSTTFRTFDNQTIHVPNNEIWGNVITNITANDERRVDMEFGIGYDDDVEEAEEIIRQVVEEHELVLDDPEPMIVMHELADSSVNIVCRPWARTGDYWTVKTEITRGVKKRFDEAGISIPFPQRDVHVYQHSPELVQH